MTTSLTNSTQTTVNASSEILATTRLLREFDPSADSMKTQKLLYFIQGSYLAQTGKPLFPESPQAWTYGPVYPCVYFDIRNNRGAIQHANTSILTNAQRELIAAVVEKFKGISATSLMKKTHEPGPWTEARTGLPDGASSQKSITHQSMMRYFSRPGMAIVSPHTCSESRWDELPEGLMESEEKRWAGLLARLAS